MKKFYTITAALGADGEKGDLPDWYLLFAAGENEVEGEGTYLVDETAWKIVEARLNRRGVDVVVDYEHQTVGDTKAPAAGWARQWRWTEAGIEARIRWNEEAKGYLAKQEYRYYSPVFMVRKSDKRLVGIHSIALTNAPKTNNIQPLLAKLGAQLQTEENMDFLKRVIAKLGLSENATEEDVLTALAGLKEKKVEAKEVIPAEVISALGVQSNDVSTVVASINVLKQETKTMVSKADFEALQAKIARRDSKEAVAAALAAGKITPDQQEWAAKYAGR
ncbi:MAG TPA: hypothetical protein ENJ30_01960, partial [Desulfobulbaceae bacterium]|nr:hypothetical protein [Desulfobulbaceae bacterium]